VYFIFDFALFLGGMYATLTLTNCTFLQTSTGENSWYLGFFLDNQDHEFGIFTVYLTFLILLDLLVPISLYVTLEFAKVGQAWLINQDIDMYHEGRFFL